MNIKKQGSSSSNVADASGPLDAVTALGQALCAQLWPEGRGNRLSMWMTYHVAERIEAARTARGAAKLAAEERCRKAILELWAHRRELEGRRPTEALEPLLDILSRLDPEKPDHFYHQQFSRARSNSLAQDEPTEVLEQIKVVDDIDCATRNLIGRALRSAADAALESTEPWVALAREAGAPNDLPIQIVLKIQGGGDLLYGEDRRRAAESARLKLAQLEVLLEIASAAKAELCDQIDEIDEGKNDDKADSGLC